MISIQERVPSQPKRQGITPLPGWQSDKVSTTGVDRGSVSIPESVLTFYPIFSECLRKVKPNPDLSDAPTIVSVNADSTPSEFACPEGKDNQVYLDLESLQGFEVVSDQFQQWGIQFRNAIALQPSNPAYPPKSGSMVLIAGPKRGWMEVIFNHPICAVSCYVTSSRRITLSGFNREDQLVAQTELPEANLANSNALTPPNALLTLTTETPQIYRINFSAFDGQFSVDDFYFDFSEQ